MVAGIYLITNKKTGQKYVGGTVDIERRIKEHKNKPRKNSYVDKAIQKHGFDSFDWQVIEELPADWKIIGEREKYWVSFYNTFEDPENYNLTEGGEGISGWTHSEKTRKKISESRIGKYGGENHPRWGEKHTNEAKRKMSKNHADFSKEKHPQWKDYPRIVLGGKEKYNGKQRYIITYNGKVFAKSVYKEKLYEKWYDKYPDIELIDQTE